MAGQLTLDLGGGKAPATPDGELPDLLPCPFCGEPARLHYAVDHRWRVHCTHCAAYLTRLFLTAEEAAEVWNMRADGGDE